MNLGHAQNKIFRRAPTCIGDYPPPGVVHDQFSWQYLLFSQKFIADYSEGLFTDDKAKHAISEFRKKLKRISAEIEQRNASLEEQYRYPYLLPNRVPNSIAI